MMPLSAAHVYYGGYSRDLRAAGDRRRFRAYAKQTGLNYSLTADTPADVAYITYMSDMPGWVARKRGSNGGPRLIFELIDSYLTKTGMLDRYIRGVGRRLEGRDSRLSADLIRSLENTIEAADAILCSTEEQREIISRINGQTFASFDHFEDDLQQVRKQDWSRNGKLKLVWEGQAATLGNVMILKNVLDELSDLIELHVITDPFKKRYYGRFFDMASSEILRDLRCDVVYHDWQNATFTTDILHADVAIIPIDMDDAMMRGKPENKLVMFWKMGMPVLTSPTPAYSRSMTAADLSMTCAGETDWVAAIKVLARQTPEQLRKIGDHGRLHAERRYSEANFRLPFDRAFTAAGFDPTR